MQSTDLDGRNYPTRDFCPQATIPLKMITILNDNVYTARRRNGAVGTSNRADACAFTSEPQLSSRRRRRRDGLPRNLHACFDSLVRVPRDTPEKLAHVRTLLGPFFVTTLMIFCCVFVCHCLGAWDWWSARGDAKFEGSFSTRRDGHSAQLASATTKQ